MLAAMGQKLCPYSEVLQIAAKLLHCVAWAGTCAGSNGSKAMSILRSAANSSEVVARGTKAAKAGKDADHTVNECK